ncbi:hypothetical protein CVT24_007639, partial [Panaeolus cyanescens]
ANHHDVPTSDPNDDVPTTNNDGVPTSGTRITHHTLTDYTICGSSEERQDWIITPLKTRPYAEGFRGWFCVRFDGVEVEGVDDGVEVEGVDDGVNGLGGDTAKRGKADMDVGVTFGIIQNQTRVYPFTPDHADVGGGEGGGVEGPLLSAFVAFDVGGGGGMKNGKKSANKNVIKDRKKKVNKDRKREREREGKVEKRAREGKEGKAIKLTVTLRVGTSFISAEQAERNIDLEIPDAVVYSGSAQSDIDLGSGVVDVDVDVDGHEGLGVAQDDPSRSRYPAPSEQEPLGIELGQPDSSQEQVARANSGGLEGDIGAVGTGDVPLYLRPSTFENTAYRVKKAWVDVMRRVEVGVYLGGGGGGDPGDGDGDGGDGDGDGGVRGDD